MRQRQRSALQARPSQAPVLSTAPAAPVRGQGEAELELRLATTLAPMLFAVATFAAAAVNVVSDPQKTLVDEFLSGLAAFCIFSASILLDSALDTQRLDWKRRVRYLGYGYICFCAVVGMATIMIPILYDAKRAGAAIYGWHHYWIFFIAAGFTVFFKMMTRFEKAGNGTATLALLLFFGLSVASLAICDPRQSDSCANDPIYSCVLCSDLHVFARPASLPLVSPSAPSPKPAPAN